MFEKNILTFNPGWDSNAQKLASFTDIRELQRQLKAQGVQLQQEADETHDGAGQLHRRGPGRQPDPRRSARVSRMAPDDRPGKGRTVLVVQEGPGKVVSFSTLNPAHRVVMDVGEKPHEIEPAPDGRTAFVSNFGLLEVNHKIGTPGTTISVLDVKTGIERERFHLPDGRAAPHGLKLRPPQYRELFTNAEAGDEGMIVFDAESGAVLRTFGLPPGVHNFIFNHDGTAIFAFPLRTMWSGSTRTGARWYVHQGRGSAGARLDRGPSAPHGRRQERTSFPESNGSIARISLGRSWRRPDFLSRGDSGRPVDTGARSSGRRGSGDRRNYGEDRSPD